MVHFKNAHTIESLSMSGKKAVRLVHELVCVGLKMVCDEGHVDNATLLFYLEALLGTCEELKSSENDKGKGRLYTERSRGVLEKLGTLIMNIVEEKQFDYLKARFIVLSLTIDGGDTAGIINSIKEMKPAVSLFNRNTF